MAISNIWFAWSFFEFSAAEKEGFGMTQQTTHVNAVLALQADFLNILEAQLPSLHSSATELPVSFMSQVLIVQ